MKPNPEQQWQWSLVDGILQTRENENTFLEFSSNLINKRNIPSLRITIQIDPKKSFNYDKELGWNWHKSWNLPEIEYSVEQKCQTSHSKESTLSVQLYITKRRENTEDVYVNLGVQGVTKYQIEESAIFFKRLKFETTSYNNKVSFAYIKHSKFQLLLLLTEIENGKETIIDAQISPDIYVDSRKYAKLSKRNINVEFFIDPFSPDHLEKDVFKRENKNKTSTLLLIDNSLTGFNNYFTSPNIRNKIIHPLFLLFKFSKCVRVFIGGEFMKKPEQIITEIQNNMSLLKDGNKVEKFVKLLVDIQTSDSQLKKKSIEIIQQLENFCYDIYTKEEYLPPNLKEITDIEAFSLVYSKIYPTLISIQCQGSIISNPSLSKSEKKLNKEEIKIILGLTQNSSEQSSDDLFTRKENPVKVENDPLQQKEISQDDNFQQFENQAYQFNQQPISSQNLNQINPQCIYNEQHPYCYPINFLSYWNSNFHLYHNTNANTYYPF